MAALAMLLLLPIVLFFIPFIPLPSSSPEQKCGLWKCGTWIIVLDVVAGAMFISMLLGLGVGRVLQKYRQMPAKTRQKP